MRHNVHQTTSARMITGLLLLTFVGCGRSDGVDLGAVRGTVTLNGEPLARAMVIFQPTDQQGTYSAAVTNVRGEYDLVYSRSRHGALTGAHVVQITTAIPDQEDERGRPVRSREILPPEYHHQSKLTADVQPGRNAIDFALTAAIASSPERQARR